MTIGRIEQVSELIDLLAVARAGVICCPYAHPWLRPLLVAPVVGNRPPFAPLSVSLAICHCDEVACGAGLLTRRVDWVGYRQAVLASTAGQAAGDRLGQDRCEFRAGHRDVEWSFRMPEQVPLAEEEDHRAVREREILERGIVDGAKH